MGRKRTATVTENITLLRHLEQQHRNKPAEARLRVLRLIKEHPLYSFARIASLAECSDRSVHRWWGLYRSGGLDAVLGDTGSDTRKNAKIGQKEIDELGRKLQTQELATLSDIRQWLKEQHDVDYTIPGVSQLVRRKLNVKRGWAGAGESGVFGTPSWGAIQSGGENPLLPKHIFRFLNSLPLLGTVQQRIVGFREALQRLFIDIDRININVNYGFNVADPSNYNPELIIRQFSSTVYDHGDSLLVTSRTVEGQTGEALLQQFRLQGYPLDDYHPPFYRDYHFEDNAYLGTIFLWRERTKEPMSQQTKDMFMALDPFIYFVLLDLAAHHQAAKPIDNAFSDALQQLADEAKLTEQERRIVIHQLLGYSYKEIADILDISLSTLKSHISTVHQKTGTRSQGELFGKYFTPRLRVALNVVGMDR